MHVYSAGIEGSEKVIADLCTYLGANFTALLTGADLVNSEELMLAREILVKRRIQAAQGNRRLRAAVLPPSTLEGWTCKQLDAELRLRQIPGRSKARRKADKINLLLTVRLS